MEQILVRRPGLGRRLRDRDALLRRVLEERGPAGEAVVELGQSPGRDDGDVGFEGVERELEPNLVVALASSGLAQRSSGRTLPVQPCETNWQPSRSAMSIIPRAITGRASEVPSR